LRWYGERRWSSASYRVQSVILGDAFGEGLLISIVDPMVRFGKKRGEVMEMKIEKMEGLYSFYSSGPET
jgi:hypothetical protein